MRLLNTVFYILSPLNRGGDVDYLLTHWSVGDLDGIIDTQFSS